MAEGYKKLISYQLARIVFDLTWEFVPQYYVQYEDARQRDQMKQAARSLKQNIVEGSEERSLSSKLKLYDVARSSGGELLEDYEDILRHEGLPLWSKVDYRFRRLRSVLEFSNPSSPSVPSCSSVLEVLGRPRRTRSIRWTREEIEIVVNYIVDCLKRCHYLLDQQIRAVEEKHKTEGGYNENLLKKRLAYKSRQW